MLLQHRVRLERRPPVEVDAARPDELEPGGGHDRPPLDWFVVAEHGGLHGDVHVEESLRALQMRRREVEGQPIRLLLAAEEGDRTTQSRPADTADATERALRDP